MPKVAGAKIIAKDKREKQDQRRFIVKTEADKIHNENELLRKKTQISRRERKKPGIMLSNRLASFEQSLKVKQIKTDTGLMY